jgi:hypothetical protein
MARSDRCTVPRLLRWNPADTRSERESDVTGAPPICRESQRYRRLFWHLVATEAYRIARWIRIHPRGGRHSEATVLNDDCWFGFEKRWSEGRAVGGTQELDRSGDPTAYRRYGGGNLNVEPLFLRLKRVVTGVSVGCRQRGRKTEIGTETVPANSSPATVVLRTARGALTPR